MSPEFTYEDMFQLGDDDAEYRLLTKDYISNASFEGKDVIRVAPEGLTYLAEEAFRDAAHLLRKSHLEQTVEILNDPEASDNDKYVSLELIKNAVISAEGIFPMCQDTGTALVIAKKGQNIWTGYSDEEALSKGVFNAYTKNNLRYSQNAPLTMYEEKILPVICLHRLIYMPHREMPTNFSLLPKAADHPTRPTCTRRQRLF